MFPETEKATIEFDLNVQDLRQGRLEIDVLDRQGNRPFWMALEGNFNLLQVSSGSHLVSSLPRYKPGSWMKFRLEVDTRIGRTDVYLNGELVLAGAQFYQDATSIERLELRTGYYRRELQHEHLHRPDGAPLFARPDLEVALSEVWLDNLSVR